MLTPPTALLPWLTCTTSLTQKLYEHAGDAQIQVLRHTWESPDDWDLQVLEVKNEPVIHREILMLAHQHPCWYARTVIPEQTVLADAKLFARLEHEPLGRLIFQSGCIERVSLQYDCLNASNRERDWLPTHTISESTQHLWRRLSTFALTASGEHFYLLEILLPGLDNYQ